MRKEGNGRFLFCNRIYVLDDYRSILNILQHHFVHAVLIFPLFYIKITVSILTPPGVHIDTLRMLWAGAILFLRPF
jgi:hypothetical protein